jgi:hypothetical protein
MNYTAKWTQPYTTWVQWQPLPVGAGAEPDVSDLSLARAVIARIMAL